MDSAGEAAVPAFTALPLDKHRWHPSPLAGQIVLVTSVDADGVVDVAPKSWVTMAAFSGPVVGFGCSTAHRTYRNVAATGEFVLNVVPGWLRQRVWEMPDRQGTDRLERSGLTLGPATMVRPPVVLDCPARFECRHLQTATFPGGEVFVFGTVVAGALDSRCRGVDAEAGYRAIDPCFYLEDGLAAGLGPVVRVPTAPEPGQTSA